jgi:hypothetical protein
MDLTLPCPFHQEIPHRFNDRDGIDVVLNSAMSDDYDGCYSSDYTRIRLTDVFAEFNGRNGLSVLEQGMNQAPTLVGGYHSSEVEIIRGGYSLNDRDGVNLDEIDNVFLSFITGVVNGDDGIETCGVISFALGNSVFVNNHDRNTVIN